MTRLERAIRRRIRERERASLDARLVHDHIYGRRTGHVERVIAERSRLEASR